MKTKLLYILPEYDPLTASHAFHIFELLSILGKKLDIFLLIEKASSNPDIKNIHRVYRQHFQLFPLNILERALIIIISRTRGYKNAYVHYSYLGAILSSLVFRPFGGKVFYWHCEYYQHFFSKLTFSLTSFNKKMLDEWLMVITLKLINYLVTCTESTADFYHKILNVPVAKIKIIPNWVNLQRFNSSKKPADFKTRLHINSNKKVILFAHRLSPRKGADYIVPIAKKVISRYQKAVFLIIGDGPYRKSLIKDINRNHLEKHIQVLGAIPNVQIPDYFSIADVFIMPSRQEGFARVLLEAMIMGVPIVASGDGGAKNILTPLQMTMFVGWGDTKTFSKKIIDLLTNSSLQKQLIADGQERVKRFEIKNVVEEFYQLFN